MILKTKILVELKFLSPVRTYSRWRRENFVELYGIDETESITVKLTDLDIKENEKLCYFEPPLQASALPKRNYDDFTDSSTSESVPMLEGEEEDEDSICSIQEEDVDQTIPAQAANLTQRRAQNQLELNDDDVMTSRFGTDDHYNYEEVIAEKERRRNAKLEKKELEEKRKKVNLPKPKSDIEFL
ncbi:unnamed protein product [Oikopleura dioica]|uniref:Uncharacterized protein n=1 Tax=Oikopleura dioica TaxID=34765 RepID=E4WSH7_OIKDI|nr:unnamed protein product [Oikopleura dioica]